MNAPPRVPIAERIANQIASIGWEDHSIVFTEGRKAADDFVEYLNSSPLRHAYEFKVFPRGGSRWIVKRKAR
ncbi:hypothetical protein [Rhodoblastus sp.]|uniref:hypothetical protein n=1 Tax=Rhodoblastus sp. TaxID=1962975 RepID=UPI003F987C21